MLTTVLTLVAMAAIAGELDEARAGRPRSRMVKLGRHSAADLAVRQHRLRAALRAFVLHEQMEPGGKDAGGLEFPGTKAPSYGDFAYFAFTLAMTFQTSDVAIRGPAMRRIALVHGFAAFLFNIGLIAFTINVLAGSSG